MKVLDFICKVIGLFSGFLNIWDKIHTYHSKTKDPSGLGARDGSEDK